MNEISILAIWLPYGYIVGDGLRRGKNTPMLIVLLEMAPVKVQMVRHLTQMGQIPGGTNNEER